MSRQRRALAMGIGCEKSVVRRAEQAPAVGIGQRRRRRIGLERVAVGRLARHAHGDASASARLGSRAHRPRLANSGIWSVTSVKPVPAPVARSAGQPARFLPAMHSSRRRKSRRKSAVSCRRCAAEPQAGMHVHAQGRLRAAQRAGLVVSGSARRTTARRREGATPKPSRSASLTAFMRSSRTFEIDARRPAARIGSTVRARPAIGARSADVLGQGVGGERAEADVVAADRHQHHVDRALALIAAGTRPW